MMRIYITCGESNSASRKTAEKLGAKLVEISPVSKEAFFYYDGIEKHCIYKLSLKTEKEIYLTDPCGTLASAYWKSEYFPLPDDMQIVHAKDADGKSLEGKNMEKFFRLIHHPKQSYDTVLPDGFVYDEINIPNELPLVADMINRCYPKCYFEAGDIAEWTEYPVFDKTLWIFIRDQKTGLPAASGIADFDEDIQEGSLDWIQVLPEYRGKGLGEKLVNELLRRLSPKAKFITVSGEVDNPTSPEKLYRKCGFTGDDVWFIIKA